MSFKQSIQEFNKVFGNKKQSKKLKRWDKKKAKNTLNDDVYKELLKMYQDGKGRSRNLDKKTPGATKNRIYSTGTYETYKQQSKKFIKWLKKEYPEIKKLNKVKVEHVNDYLKYLINNDYSAYSISTSKAAISKVLHIPSTEFIKTPARTRAAIKRSRYEAKRDSRISAKNEAYFAKITSAIGGRSREIRRLTGEDLHFNRNGKPFVYISNGKGGKKRMVPIIGKDDKETQEIVEMFKEAGKLRVFPSLPSAFDNHYYRGIYAKRIYNIFARPIDSLPEDEKYRMRKDMKGVVLDREAMLKASRVLGHGKDRVDVVAQHYLY